MRKRRNEGLIMACVTLASALFINVYADYLDQLFDLKFKTQDVRTVTTDDYAVELGFGPHVYKEYITKLDPGSGLTEFKKWLKTRIELMLNFGENFHFANSKHGVRVVCIFFQFNSEWLIKLL